LVRNLVKQMIPALVLKRSVGIMFFCQFGPEIGWCYLSV
jgi:hypothetical protein